MGTAASKKRKPQRTDGIGSKNKLKKTALKLFSENSFVDVSISQITRLSKLSTGAFYQYYVNKDEVFREIVDDFFRNFDKDVNGNNLREVTISFANYCTKNSLMTKALYLNEYSFEWIRNEFDAHLLKLSKKFGLSYVEHFYFWAPLRFCVFFGDLLEIKINYDELFEIILEGIGKDCPNELPANIFSFVPERRMISTDERREQILSNAESLFGTYGFNKTQVYDIARSTGIAIGTVYLYFENKKEILHELVRIISKGLRYNVKLSLEKLGKQHRLVEEIAGLYAFVQFFRIHSNMYKIVRESQSIDHAIAKEYYRSLYDSYVAALKKALEKGEIKDFNLSYIALMMMSYGHYAGERYILSGRIGDQNSERLEEFLKELYSYLCKGLEGKECYSTAR